MASNINNSLIDENFPVAGQDNDSNGFRENFNQIKTNLGIATTEITTLQNETAKLNADNTFFNDEQNVPVKLIKPELKETTLAFYTTGNQTNPQTEDLSLNFSGDVGAHYHVVTVGSGTPGATTTMDIDVTEWASSGRHCTMRVEIYARNGDTVNVTWTAGLNNTLKTDGNAIWDNFTVNSATNPYVLEFWTWNGGNTVYGRYLGQYS